MDEKPVQPAKTPTPKRVTVPAPVVEPNPPVQPRMTSARQIPGAIGDYQGAAPRPPLVTTAGLRVVATRMGYYGDKIQRVNDVFTIRNDSEYSAHWMAYVDPATPERTTGSNAALRHEHDAILSGAPRTDGIIVGRDDVGDVPTGTHNPLGD